MGRRCQNIIQSYAATTIEWLLVYLEVIGGSLWSRSRCLVTNKCTQGPNVHTYKAVNGIFGGKILVKRETWKIYLRTKSRSKCSKTIRSPTYNVVLLIQVFSSAVSLCLQCALIIRVQVLQMLRGRDNVSRYFQRLVRRHFEITYFEIRSNSVCFF